ncbi:MAG: hypothetical protein AB2705_18925, partial [Candidatus Thiodiazotropha sp.]
QDLFNELKEIPPEEHLKYIQYRISQIKNDEQRAIAEIFINVGIHAADYNHQNNKVIVLIHGIRTYAEWFDLLKYEIEKNKNTSVYFIKYGFFDALRFWFPFFTRTGVINHVKRQLRNIRNEHRTDDFIIVAHSFGTYVISRILSSESDIDIKRLLMCGSIIPEKFRWDLIPKLPKPILNDCGTRDIWPIAAKALSWGYGTSGSFGFNSIHIEDRYFNVDHSGFFNSDFITTYWLPFIIDGKIKSSNETLSRSKPSYLKSIMSIIPLKLIITFLLLYATLTSVL